MESGPIVIVGAGQGGLQVAASLRQAGYEGELTLIGNEPGLPYQRPPLSKAYMQDGNPGALKLRAAEFYDKQQIRYLPETSVTAIDRDDGRIATTSGELDFGHLILATGASNLRPPIPGLDRTLDLRTLADADKLRERATGDRRFAVIGGGFIGLEFAAVASKFGLDVVVAEAAPRLMARAVSPQMSELFLKKHRDLGSTVLLGDPVSAIDDRGIALVGGTHLEADEILLAAGVRPNTVLAEAAGLDCANGVTVDAQLLTSDPRISALGDCACFPDSRSGLRIRLESVQAATDHARHIAARLTGKQPDPYNALPWFWSDQADYKLQIAGLAQPDDRAEAVDEHVVFRFDAEDRLTAVETVNNARVHMRTRKLLAGGETVGPDTARDLLS
ncbi:NAD(P)/FAD-dependent oxidoreductase [Paracoccus tegillarcae]|uniref:Pyridine nucleotide-disulfide oxidoreductase n=1 Tax=Paracoccus tegillarcae TaxID=1529068 RepID=A0A2K9EH48_9RHOB|nr:FAD-dependent oxidoreductase [Paracoccus tegillarcae]AUH32637.1 pyridine nucleotide-disulfide oxidoreductase [Paracoccus tegillarcae]